MPKISLKQKANPQTGKEFSAVAGRALRRAAKVARKTAGMHGTPIYIWKDGKSPPKSRKQVRLILQFVAA